MLSRRSFLQTTGAGAFAARLLSVADSADAPALAQTQGAERGDSQLAGRPELISGNRRIVFGGLTRVPSLAMVNLANKSYAITAEIQVPVITPEQRLQVAMAKQ